MKNTLLLLVFLFCTGYVLAQANNSTVLTGKIVDTQGNPLAGVSIYLKSKAGGTSSAINGAFQLKVKDGDVVIFTYVGWGTCEYTLPEIELEFNNW